MTIPAGNSQNPCGRSSTLPLTVGGWLCLLCLVSGCVVPPFPSVPECVPEQPEQPIYVCETIDNINYSVKYDSASCGEREETACTGDCVNGFCTCIPTAECIPQTGRVEVTCDLLTVTDNEVAPISIECESGNCDPDTDTCLDCVVDTLTKMCLSYYSLTMSNCGIESYKPCIGCNTETGDCWDTPQPCQTVTCIDDSLIQVEDNCGPESLVHEVPCPYGCTPDNTCQESPTDCLVSECADNVLQVFDSCNPDQESLFFDCPLGCNMEMTACAPCSGEPVYVGCGFLGWLWYYDECGTWLDLGAYAECDLGCDPVTIMCLPG